MATRTDGEGKGREIASSLQKVFGDWPGPMMKELVAEYFNRLDPRFAAGLLDYIVSWYSPVRPGGPSLAEIRRLAEEMPPLPPVMQIEDGSSVSRDEAADGMRGILEILAKKHAAKPKSLQRQADDWRASEAARAGEKIDLRGGKDG